MQFHKFCESSLAFCLGTYIFPWCSPDVTGTQFSENTLNQIVRDVEAHIKKA